ncbi:unnamed protein product [Periconia digitata]|uniref:Zn(2)-C6 fungal-type domain-containing protein n=1 Tax=Periconia digitata TaxID=1303443 RepID=A0A9W4UM76_9PLEO|nr:unnamed protein product [Periconia digitata]
MTLKGKCQTCRARKVKCDERKPKCSACSKGNRECTYNAGTPAAFVVEDPTRYSKHGKAQVAPRVYPLPLHSGPSSGRLEEIISSSEVPAKDSPEATGAVYRVTSERHTGGGGMFRTLAVISKERANDKRMYSHQQRRRLQLHLQYLKRTATSIPYQAISPETQLVKRYISVLDGRPLETQPLAILGTWIESIPARIGCSPHVDLAVEFLADSLRFFREKNFSNRKVALRAKAKALKSLQLAVDQCRTRQTYDTAIAMKIHFAAEVFMGITDFFHAIHTVALGELLRVGPLADPDEEHAWSLIDNTYGEDVSEALVASRSSIYDNEYWINATRPAAIPHHASLLQRASMSIMHLAIRLPRLVCLVRYIVEHPEETDLVALAFDLAATLWSVDPVDELNRLFDASITRRPIPPDQEIADIVSDTIYFDSVVTAVQASRYWSTMISLCGVTETLYINFPEFYAEYALPNITGVYHRDEESASGLARCIPYALSIDPALPILPLRIYTTLNIAAGTWHRLAKRLKVRQESGEADNAEIIKRLEQAERMIDWTVAVCNDTHDLWKVQRIGKELLLAAVEDMAGGPVHHWLPRAVSFEAEDGEMVMKLKYGIPLPSVKEDGDPHVWNRSTTTRSPFEKNKDMGPRIPPSLLNKPVRFEDNGPQPIQEVTADESSGRVPSLDCPNAGAS